MTSERGDLIDEQLNASIDINAWAIVLARCAAIVVRPPEALFDLLDRQTDEQVSNMASHKKLSLRNCH
jgi:hypothetical protein